MTQEEYEPPDWLKKFKDLKPGESPIKWQARYGVGIPEELQEIELTPAEKALLSRLELEWECEEIAEEAGQ